MRPHTAPEPLHASCCLASPACASAGVLQRGEDLCCLFWQRGAVPPPWETTRSVAASVVFLSTKTKGRVPDGCTSTTGADLGTSTPLRGTPVPKPAGPRSTSERFVFGSLFPRWEMFSLDDKRTSSLSLGYFDRTGRSWWETALSHSGGRSSLFLAKAEIILELIRRSRCHRPGLRALRAVLSRPQRR